MNIKNKKGFTLTEILVTVGIISLVMLIAIPNILFVSKKIKQRTQNATQKLVLNAAKEYGKDNRSEFFNATTTCRVITIEDLVNNNYYEEENLDGISKTKQIVLKSKINAVSAKMGNSCS